MIALLSLKQLSKPIALVAVCFALISIRTSDCANGTIADNVRFALFWPQNSSASEASRMFAEIFQPWLQTVCPKAGNIKADFVHLELPHGIDRLKAVITQLTEKPVLFASIKEDPLPTVSASTEAVEVLRMVAATLASSRAAGAPLEVHSISPPSGATLASLLLRVLRVAMRLPTDETAASTRRLGLLLGKPFSLVDLHSVLKAFGGRVFVQSLDDRIGDSEQTEAAVEATYAALAELELQGVSDLLVVANRRAAHRLLRLSIKTPVSRPMYRWLVFNGDLTDSPSGHQWPNPSLNVTTVEFQKPQTAAQRRALSNRTDSLLLHDQLSIWTQFLANFYCSNSTVDGAVVKGLTGDFRLCSNGSVDRLNWRFDIYRGLLAEAELVGRISTDDHFNMSDPIDRTGSRAEILGDVKRRKFRVFTILEGPYVRFKKGLENRTDLLLKNRLEGFSFDLCLRVLDNLGITDFTVQFQNDTIYGDRVYGEWNGLIQSIMQGRVDLACVAMNPISSRAEVIDFTATYLSYNLSLLYTEEPADAWTEIFLFTLPYNKYTWLAIIGTTFMIALLLTALHRISPNNVNFDLLHSLHFAFASLWRGPREARLPNKPGTRVLVAAFWLFSLAVLAYYTAGLSALLALRRIQVDLSALQNLPKQTNYKYGTLGDSSFSILLKNSSFLYMRSIYSTMATQRWLMNSASQGIAKVRAGGFALIYDTPMNQYFQQQICNARISAYFQTYEVAFAAPRMSELRGLVSEEIMNLKSAGELKSLYAKYFTVSPEDRPDCSTQSTRIARLIPEEPAALAPQKGALTLVNTLGIFLVNLIGCASTVLAALMERCWATFLYRYRQLRSAESALSEGAQRRRRSTLATVLTSMYSSSEA